MKDLLIANTLTHLRFCLRNRLLLTGALFFLFFMGVHVLESYFFLSLGQRFNIIMSLFQGLSAGIGLLLGLLALVISFYHRSNKCVKLVFTKPCSPSIWIASNYLTALILFTVGMLGVLALLGFLFLYWGIPWQWGLLGAMVYDFSTTAMFFSFLLLLSTILHPVVALLAFFLFTDQTFYYLSITFQQMANDNGSFNGISQALSHICWGVYMLLPNTQPFSTELENLSSFRLGEGNLKYLAGSLLYAAIFITLSFHLTRLALHRQRHV